MGFTESQYDKRLTRRSAPLPLGGLVLGDAEVSELRRGTVIGPRGFPALGSGHNGAFGLFPLLEDLPAAQLRVDADAGAATQRLSLFLVDLDGLSVQPRRRLDQHRRMRALKDRCRWLAWCCSPALRRRPDSPKNKECLTGQVLRAASLSMPAAFARRVDGRWRLRGLDVLDLRVHAASDLVKVRRPNSAISNASARPSCLARCSSAAGNISRALCRLACLSLLSP
jgi:hypothetical protein